LTRSDFATEIPAGLANIAGLLGQVVLEWGRAGMALGAMVGDAPQPGLPEPGLTGRADLLAAAVVLVVGVA
jgi:hypothetical protein